MNPENQESNGVYLEGEQEIVSSNPFVRFIKARIAYMTKPSMVRQMIWATGSIILALLIGAVVMNMAEYNTGLAFLVLLRSPIVQFDRVLFNATPLIFTGLSVALAFKCGLFNIGPEGQLYIGALAAAVGGYLISLPFVIHPLFCLVFASLAGFVWGFVPGLLKAYRGAHEVVTTMMITYSTLLLTQWLVKEGGPFWEGGDINQTPVLLETSWISFPWSDFLNFGIIIAILVVIACDFFINRTVLGYEMRAVGLNRDAAEYAGINAKRNIALSLGIAGALAGLGGGVEILGYHHRFIDNWSVGLGWDGITVAVLGNNNPWGVLGGAIFFGALRTGGAAMQRIAGVPAEMVVLIQGLIVMLVAAPRIVEWFKKQATTEVSNLKVDLYEPISHLLIVGFALYSAIAAFSPIITYTSFSPLASFVLLIIGSISVIAFIQLFSREEKGKRTLVFALIGWIGIVLIGVSLMRVYVITQAITMILIGLVLLVINRFLPRMKQSSDEVETEPMESAIQ